MPIAVMYVILYNISYSQVNINGGSSVRRTVCKSDIVR